MKNARKSLHGRVNFIITQREFFERTPPHGGHGIVDVIDLEHLALLVVEREETVLEDALPHLAHQPMIEENVMLAEELPSQSLFALREVVQVGAIVTSASRAGAVGVQRLLRALINTTPHLKESARREASTALRHLRWDDTVKHIHPAMNGLKNVERCADPHEITRPILWQQLSGELTRVLTLTLPLPHG